MFTIIKFAMIGEIDPNAVLLDFMCVAAVLGAVLR